LSVWYTSMFRGDFSIIYEKNERFEMYKNILISKNEQILLKTILTEYIQNSPINQTNIHILIRHICGSDSQIQSNEYTSCGKSTINQI